jgi:hypothetical protein
MKKEPAWLAAARALPFGRKRKIVCTECHSSSPTLMIHHGSKGYDCYCFRGSCGFQAYEPHGLLSLAELEKRRADVSSLIASQDISLPSDVTSALPDTGRLWLLQAGVNDFLTQAYGILYSPRYRRVILPLTKGCTTEGYIARALDGSTPKYLSKLRDPSSALFLSNSDYKLEGQNDFNLDFVITEDALSAIRVGRIVQSGAILGTSFGDGHLRRVLDLAAKPNPRIGVWMDGDKAGEHSRARIRRMLTLCGAEVFSVRTKRDPKRFANREIRLCLTHGSDTGWTTSPRP